MAQKGIQKASVGLPPRGPTITTQMEATTVEQVGPEWVIVAKRAAGTGDWKPTMPYEEWRVFRAMVDDGAATTIQRRDLAYTVLLARLKEAE
jgi:hypothetical protein